MAWTVCLQVPRCCSTAVSAIFGSWVERVAFKLTYYSVGEFYGINPRTANVELVARFFEKYPSYVEKAFLSVKVFVISTSVLFVTDISSQGGSKPDKLERDAS